MFRHKSKNELVVDKNPSDESIGELKSPVELSEKKEENILEKTISSKTDFEQLKNLLEKNLKWSQIIYEQNRKINNKLLWSAIFGWLRVLLILVPIILAFQYLPPIIQNLQNTYGSLLGGKTTSVPLNQNSIEQLLKILPLDQINQEQLKAILK